MFSSFLCLILNLFQFHKGAIRTKRHNPATDGTDKFQFHKGAIRTSVITLPLTELINFNSIKVRLERYSEYKTNYDKYKFQFHKGAIRTFSRETLVSGF